MAEYKIASLYDLGSAAPSAAVHTIRTDDFPDPQSALDALVKSACKFLSQMNDQCDGTYMLPEGYDYTFSDIFEHLADDSLLRGAVIADCGVEYVLEPMSASIAIDNDEYVLSCEGDVIR